MTLMQREIKQRSETIQNIASHMYTASHRIPATAESALNEAMTILLIENEECRRIQEKEREKRNASKHMVER